LLAPGLAVGSHAAIIAIEEVDVAQLIVRNIEEEVVQALKERAVRHRRSAEAEHREILREALVAEPAEDPKTVLLEMPDVGEDSDFARIRDLPRRIDL
jgi:plasmid stability protein